LLLTPLAKREAAAAAAAAEVEEHSQHAWKSICGGVVAGSLPRAVAPVGVGVALGEEQTAELGAPGLGRQQQLVRVELPFEPNLEPGCRFSLRLLLPRLSLNFGGGLGLSLLLLHQSLFCARLPQSRDFFLRGLLS